MQEPIKLQNSWYDKLKNDSCVKPLESFRFEDEDEDKD